MVTNSFLQTGKGWFIPVSLFFLFLAYFFFGTGWYEPTKLILRGQALSGVPLIKVRWDSGQGFNNYEQRKFQILKFQDNNEIILGATGRKNKNSCTTDVVCTAIFVDGKAIDLSSVTEGRTPHAGGLHFKGGETISFTMQPSSHIGFKFSTDCQTAGNAFISVNGVKSDHDLFLSNEPTLSAQFDYWILRPDGSFSIEIDMPRYQVRTLEILNGKSSNSINLISAQLIGKEKKINLLHNGHSMQLGSVRFNKILDGMKSYFHPLQFCQQVIFSLLSAWLLTTLIRLVQEAISLRDFFLTGKRPLFWLMLAISMTVFGIWLAAFWPGILSIDSFKIWRAATLPDVYSNEHPLLNIILYKYLYHILGNTVVVPVAQVLLTALLISWFGFYVIQQGASIKVVLFWLLFVLCSIPVGVYNVVLWKDIPFALLTVLWAVMLVKLRQEKKKKLLRYTGQRICALLLLGLSLGLIRHNGLVYLFILPMLFLLLRMLFLRKIFIGLLVILIVTGISFIILSNTKKHEEKTFFVKAISFYTSTMKMKNVIKDTKRMIRDYTTILDIESPQSDKFHYCMRGIAWWQLLHSGWWDAYPYHPSLNGESSFPQLRNAAMQLYEWSYTKPWLWLMWNPVWLLALLPLLTVCFRWLPNTAILGAMLLSGALPLVYLQIFNWRYYYFLYFGLLFLPAFFLLDFQQWRTAGLKQNT